MWRLQDGGQAYDGASTMSSEACGVKGRMRRIAPIDGTVHSFQQSRFESQCCSRMHAG